MADFDDHNDIDIHYSVVFDSIDHAIWRRSENNPSAFVNIQLSRHIRVHAMVQSNYVHMRHLPGWDVHGWRGEFG